MLYRDSLCNRNTGSRAHMGDDGERAGRGEPAAGGDARADPHVASQQTASEAIVREFADMRADAIFGKLRILANLRTGEKLSFAPMRIDPPGVSSALMRWWNSEGRDRTVIGLHALYDRAMRLAADEKDSQVAEQLIRLIARSVVSMERLRGTYRDDQTTVGTLSGLQDTVELRLARIRARAARRGARAQSDPVDAK